MNKLQREVEARDRLLTRRAFLKETGTAGVALTSAPYALGALGAQGQRSEPAESSSEWSVTLGAGDGPHPPFVSNLRRLLAAPELYDAPDEWIDRSMQWIEYILQHYPPGWIEVPERRPALFRLDEVLHIPSAPNKPLIQKFYRSRLQNAIQEIEAAKVTEGMRIWRLYNHGVLVRTPSVTFTMDLVPGAPGVPGFALPTPWLDRLVAQSDVTFISHWHPDHANKDVARMFLAAGKPVIAPEGLWADDVDLAKMMTYPERSTAVFHTIHVGRDSQALQFVSYPGHQGKPVLVNINLVLTPEGYSVLHTGDQSGDEGNGTDFDWLAHIGHYHHVDVLLPNGWANDLHRIIRGVNPELVIPGHENEMSHAVAHREEYTQDYERLFGLHYSFITLTWGESFLYCAPAYLVGDLPDEN